MKPTNVIDYGSLTANMYGCEPCPKCASVYRAPFKRKTDQVVAIECDDCGLSEPVDNLEELAK